MKIILIKLLATVILAGVLNTTIIEPAICFMHEEVVFQGHEEDQCCVVCHSVHHQGIIPAHVNPSFEATDAVDFVRLPQFSLSDLPSRAIFHPPLAF